MKSDENILSKILETQNKILDLTADKNITRITVKAVSSFPGINSCRICMGNISSQIGEMNLDPCEICDNSREREKEITPVPKETECGLKSLPGVYVIPVETVDHRFGFIIISLDRDELFAEYKPFIKNLGNFIALNLEIRLQKQSLQKGNNALEEKEKHYRQLLSSVTDYIYSVKVSKGQTVSTVHGPHCVSVTGYTPEDYEADPDLWYRMVHEEDRTAVREQAAHILSGKQVEPLEHRIIHRDGSLRWVRHTAVLRRDIQGHLVAYDGLIQDISSRKKAEEALETERALLDRITDTSPVSITMVNREGEIVFANRRAEELLGLTKSEIMQRTYNAPQWKITDLEGGPYPEEKLPFRLVMEGRKQVLDIRHAIEWPDGRRVYLSINGAPLFNENSEIESVVFTIEDITLRVKNEEILREKQDLLLEAQRIAHMGNWWHDLVTGEMFWSHEFFRILGREPQKPTPELAFKVIHPDDLQIVEKAMEESAAGKIENEHEFRIVRPDGEIRWIHNHWVTIYDKNGNQLKHIGTHQDITEQIRTEQERLNYLHYLESMSSTSRAIHGSDDLEKMMTDVLDGMLSIFDCDRAWLAYPCDPDAESWSVPMERIKPEYPGASVFGLDVPMNDVFREIFRNALKSDGPVKYGTGAEHSLAENIAREFSLKSYIMIALHPKVGKPWLFGMHQCSFPRQWTAEEERLFQEIGRRVEDALTSLLSYRNLQESEERYRLVFENSPVSIWEEDFSGVKTYLNSLRKETIDNIDSYLSEHPDVVRRCVEQVKIRDVNRSALTLHGAENKDELTAGLVNLFTPESFDTFRQELVSIWKGETEMRMDSVVKTLAGDLRNVTVSFFVCPGYEDTLSRVIVSLVDITERKVAEKELLKSNDLLRAIIEAAPVAIIGLDLEGKVRSVWNPAAEKMLGWSAGEVMGRFLPTVSVEREEEFRKFREWIEKGLTLDGVEVRRQKRNGEPIDYSIYAAPLYDQGKSIAGNIAVLVDITERKTVEEKLRQSEQRLRLHVEQSSLGFLEWDDQFRAAEWNAACERIFGYTREEAIGRHAKELVLPAEVHELVDGIYQSLMEQTGGQHSINENITKDGRIIICEWFNTTLTDENGKGIAVASVCRDITEQKKMEEELTRYREHLEELVKARTAELETANRELEAFAYSVSHDLRAPLRHINGFLDMLKGRIEATLDEKGRKYMDFISHSAGKMGQLIDDLLSFSRMGRQAIRFNQSNLGDIVHDVIGELQSDISGRNILWQIGELPGVSCDPSMMRIALMNLVSNAIKFTESRDQAIIEIASFRKENEKVVFIRDNGVGFEPKYADKLFGVFQRLHHADEFEGTGVGLAITQRIIHRHGGRIWAEGEPGKGATFYFSLPYI